MKKTNSFNNENVLVFESNDLDLLDSFNNHLSKLKTENDFYSEQITEMIPGKAALSTKFQIPLKSTTKLFELRGSLDARTDFKVIISSS